MRERVLAKRWQQPAAAQSDGTMAARSPTTSALGRSCRMRAARPAGLSPARGDGTPLALAALASDVEAGGGNAAGDDEAGVALWLPTTGAGEPSAAATASLTIGDEEAQEYADFVAAYHATDNTNDTRQTAR